MLANNIIATLVLGLAATVSAANNKANEYKSGDCSGSLNYGHTGVKLATVTMDDSSHSVYLATGATYGPWLAYEGKTSNGGSCTGAYLGDLPGECVNLDNHFSGRRIRCVAKTLV
ncbi:hypothetical protein K4K61_005540 [Colletotrichum sp. SAR11_59]|uniref:Small secreted protein n=2 Tax=Colletotrichum gloeosporioides species complex TaxID=2707338 RepID=A0A8H4FHK8_COLGL|nr:uncharacterized protein CGCS363_v003295 [Colletotrichum siamense]XP_045261722.1 uncharacterized protein GCG54_00003368 [Colletotrichum gloeosporioides]KAF0324786.1 hypothetical protein GQ607_007957 [Colletotrichum asianum]KAI8164638.1 hypothetical protein K4K50_011665 [Colletotrichum sp. SAR 10_71]KAI8185942.1 hypothetical protein KHU50_001533 [Colletotrichum sp. SAR 10_65]KAI8194874.1 hypothetical protein K4K49_009072 [Colletotrichum sp. SAR 10_70]KAI8316502.1 hypothetical protein K4K61_0